MSCYICGAGIDTIPMRSFTPVDPKGTKNRRWICNVCQGTKAKTIEDVLFDEESKNEQSIS